MTDTDKKVCPACKGERQIGWRHRDGRDSTWQWMPCSSCQPKPIEFGHEHALVFSGTTAKCTVCSKTWTESEYALDEVSTVLGSDGRRCVVFATQTHDLNPDSEDT